MESVRDYWDAQAETFDDEPDHGLRDPAVRRTWLALLREHLPPAPARIADLGCGTGTLSVLLAEDGHHVVGIDLSEKMVAAARTKAAEAGVDAAFAQGDAADPQLASGDFDVVLSRHVLWALPDPSRALERWVSLLAPEGRLLLVEGHWFTGGGLAAQACSSLVRGHRHEADVLALDDAAYWGHEITDERYLLVSRS
ncbi:MAG TPA: class I SAM-dependent methyltransferase [Marmoricola sp.]|nr:class I SAM-dependent methyltransferase [Marmoricola sp.]